MYFYAVYGQPERANLFVREFTYYLNKKQT